MCSAAGSRCGPQRRCTARRLLVSHRLSIGGVQGLGEARVKAGRSEGKIFVAAKIFRSGGGSATGVFVSDRAAVAQTLGAAKSLEGPFAAETGHAAGGSGGLLRRVFGGRERCLSSGRHYTTV
jgi:hypothetical protein